MKKRYKIRFILLLVLSLLFITCSIFWLKSEKANKETNPADSLNQTERPKGKESRESKLSKEELEKKYPQSNHLLLGLKGSEHTLVKEGDEYIESGAYALDDRSGAVLDIEISGTVNTKKPGDYTVEYTAKSDKAIQKIKRKVSVIPASEFDADKDGIPVLMYHYVYTDSDMPEKVNTNYIKDEDLEKQLSWLNENKYYFPSFAELSAYIDGKISLPAKSVILTFDDGQVGFLKYGIPLLEKYRIPATSFIIGTRNGPEIVKDYRSKYVSYQSHSFDMHRAGGNIGHGGRISAMSIAEIEDDLKQARNMVGNNEAFAYPFGDMTEDAMKAVRNCKIDCAFSTVYGKVEKGDDKAALCRIRVHGAAGLDAFISSIQ